MPDPAILLALAAAGWGAALFLLIAWRRAAPRAARVPELARRLEEAEARHGEISTRADEHQARVVTLHGEKAGLGEAVSRLQAQLDEAAAERARIAREATAERAAIQDRLDAAREEIKALEVARGRDQTALAARVSKHDEDVALLTELRADMTDRFKALAEATLADQGATFGTLNRERVEALMKPVREQVEHFQVELRNAHQGAAKDRARLTAEIEGLARRSEEVSREAVALTNALKGEKQRQGAWGEMILERVLEDSGLRKGHEYETQVSVTAEDGGRRRPDAVVRLPGDKVVVIDAKVSLVAYEAAVNADDEATRARHMNAHVLAVQKHIDELAARDYGGLVDGAVDYTVMFMPVEGALAAALEVRGDITSRAIAKRVGIATPTTLMMALRTIQHVWAVERRESNAEEIADRAGKLFDKMAGVVEAFEKVGDHLGRARSEHETALDRLSRGNGNVLGQFDKLARLGARTGKTFAVPFDEHAEDALAPLAAAPPDPRPPG